MTKDTPAPDLVVFSPHLDDAVFSAYALLGTTPRLSIEMATLVTEPGASWDSGWGVLTGFSTGEEEFATRRQEDVAAAALLEVSCRHLGGQSDRVGESAGLLEHHVDAIMERNPAAILFIPAGAGRSRRKLSWQRLRNRLLRQPPGAPPHPDHEFVRDALTDLCRRKDITRIGYYLENPYYWSDSVNRLKADLGRRSGMDLTLLDLAVDGQAKLAACSTYASQVQWILGMKQSYRERALSFPERYLVAPALLEELSAAVTQ